MFSIIRKVKSVNPKTLATITMLVLGLGAYALMPKVLKADNCDQCRVAYCHGWCESWSETYAACDANNPGLSGTCCCWESGCYPVAFGGCTPYAA